jgi:hypothetical protein
VTTNKRLEISSQSRNVADDRDRDRDAVKSSVTPIRRLFASSDFVKGNNVNSRSVRYQIGHANVNDDLWS